MRRSASASASRRAHPHLPHHVLEHHRKVLATILKKRLAIEQWRRHVRNEMTPSTEPHARPTYQNRLSQEFSELRSALPARLQPATSDRVTIMSNAMSYIVYLKNSLHQFRGEATERVPEYTAPHENCMIRMLTQVLPTISVMPSKIQLIEHATQTIYKLETEYYHLLQAQSRKQGGSPASSAATGIRSHSRVDMDMETEVRSTSSAGAENPLRTMLWSQSSSHGPSVASSTTSISCPPTPKEEDMDVELEVRSTSSLEGIRLPSIREILQDKTVSTNLLLPPLRFTSSR
ncbi:hypothetical protein BDZ89DRAFT_1065309 [Hymenopellis radicata]|nr:hypothetical protein BDZ89DRAFT_1065309 [Hymenopellis radicata]